MPSRLPSNRRESDDILCTRFGKRGGSRTACHEDKTRSRGMRSSKWLTLVLMLDESGIVLQGLYESEYIDQESSRIWISGLLVGIVHLRHRRRFFGACSRGLEAS